MTETCFPNTTPDFANLESPNPAYHVVAEKLTSGNSLIGTDINTVSMWCYYTGSPAGTKFRFGVWDSSTNARATSDAVNVSELGNDTDPPKYSLSIGSTITLAEGDSIGIMTLSAPSGYGIKIRQCDGCSAGGYPNGNRVIFTQDSGSQASSTADVNFCVSEGATPTTTLLNPPQVAYI